MHTLVTLSGTCPTCGHALKLCQAKAGPLYIGCSAFPRCTFRCPYDPILQKLRDDNAKLRAQVTLLEMQRPTETTVPLTLEERRRGLTTWAHVAYRHMPHASSDEQEVP